MPRRLGQDEFIIRRAPLVTNPRDNTEYRDWDNATDTLVIYAQVQPFLLSEKLNFEITKEREFVRAGMRFFAPVGTDIRHTDRVIYLDDEYEVFGLDAPWTNFRGRLDHVAFIARRREG
jgi:hypothetical protein